MTNQAEQEDNFRLKKAREFLAHCRTKENEARVTLAQAVESSKRAKERFESLFVECDRRAVERRERGEVFNNPGY